MDIWEEFLKDLKEIGFHLYEFDDGTVFKTYFKTDYITRIFYSPKYAGVRIFFYSTKDEFYKGEFSYYELYGFCSVKETYDIEMADKAIKKLEKFKKKLEKIKADLQPILEKYDIKEWVEDEAC